MKRRSFVKGLGAFGTLAASSGLSAPSLLLGSRAAYAQNGEIPVGLLFSLTGAVAVVERTLHDAALMAIEEINAAGGVHGMQLKPYIEDPASDPATYADRARRLMIRDNCVSVFGSYTMKEFLGQYPEITLDATLTDLTVDLLETGTDVAVRIGAQHDSTLIAKRLSTQRRVLAAAPGYVHTNGLPAVPEDLADHECLSFTLGQPVHWYYRSKTDSKDLMRDVPVGGHLRTNDTEALRDATIAEQGIALLPTWLIADDIRAGRLVLLMPDLNWNISPVEDTPIWGVYPPKRVVSPKVRVFLDFIVKRFGSPPYWEQS